MDYPIYEKLDKKLWKPIEEHSFPEMYITIFEHVSSNITKYPSYLLYIRFQSIPCPWVITASNLNDLDIINDWNPHTWWYEPWGMEYKEIAIKVVWTFELSQIADAFKRSRYQMYSSWDGADWYLSLFYNYTNGEPTRENK